MVAGVGEEKSGGLSGSKSLGIFPMAELPTKYGDFVVFAFRGEKGEEHVAVVKGNVCGAERVLVRVHSECLTGDVFGSLRCDCGEQLENALRKISEEGLGVLLYMRQEGRGIGLYNKIRAYSLQDHGLNTVEANHRLGFPADLRHYREAAKIIKRLGIRSVRLMTNNPQKLRELKENGVKIVERVPLEVVPNRNNHDYLLTKRTRLGHLIQTV
ncbi:MAG: GTP cyclohydrolase II [Methanobacteriota archaeon]|nr:MAG: GTP cyclohydrolase II [Euryarchaeota archaeon]